MASNLPTLEDVAAQVETWAATRVELAASFTQDGFREFCTQNNYRSRRLIAAFGREDPEFWTALAELATNAATLVTPGAKVRADHRDMTKE